MSRYCPECGAEIPQGTKFCSACGNKIEQGSEKTKGVSTEALSTNKKTEKLLKNDQIAKTVKEILTDEKIAAVAKAFEPKLPSEAPPEAHSIFDLNKKAWWLAGIIGVIFLGILFITGVVWQALHLVMGIIPLVLLIMFALINLYISKRLQLINELIIKGEYQQAKNKQLILAVLGLIFGFVIVGVIILVAYSKYNALFKAT